MQQCAVRQFENELVECLSILANRHLRPPAPERGPHSTGIRVHHAKLGCFGRLTVRAICCTRNIFKKPCAVGDIDIFTCFGPVLYEGSMEGV